jgi:hypothetical protein
MHKPQSNLIRELPVVMKLEYSSTLTVKWSVPWSMHMSSICEPKPCNSWWMYPSSIAPPSNCSICSFLYLCVYVGPFHRGLRTFQGGTKVEGLVFVAGSYWSEGVSPTSCSLSTAMSAPTPLSPAFSKVWGGQIPQEDDGCAGVTLVAGHWNDWVDVVYNSMFFFGHLMSLPLHWPSVTYSGICGLCIRSKKV